MRVNPDDKPLGDVASQVRQDEAADRAVRQEIDTRRQDTADQAKSDHRSWMRDVFVPKD